MSNTHSMKRWVWILLFVIYTPVWAASQKGAHLESRTASAHSSLCERYLRILPKPTSLPLVKVKSKIEELAKRHRSLETEILSWYTDPKNSEIFNDEEAFWFISEQSTRLLPDHMLKHWRKNNWMALKQRADEFGFYVSVWGLALASLPIFVVNDPLQRAVAAGFLVNSPISRNIGKPSAWTRRLVRFLGYAGAGGALIVNGIIQGQPSPIKAGAFLCAAGCAKLFGLEKYPYVENLLLAGAGAVWIPSVVENGLVVIKPTANGSDPLVIASAISVVSLLAQTASYGMFLSASAQDKMAILQWDVKRKLEAWKQGQEVMIEGTIPIDASNVKDFSELLGLDLNKQFEQLRIALVSEPVEFELTLKLILTWDDGHPKMKMLLHVPKSFPIERLKPVKVSENSEGDSEVLGSE